MSNGKFATPPDHDPHLDEQSGAVRADEHNHVAGLSNMMNGESESMKHVLLAHLVTMCRIEDDRRGIVIRKVTCHKLTCQRSGERPNSCRTLDRVRNHVTSLAPQSWHGLRLQGEGNPARQSAGAGCHRERELARTQPTIPRTQA